MRSSLHHRRPGFLILEILIGITLFATFVSIVGFALYFSQTVSVRSGDRMRAVTLSSQAVAAVRSMRDEDFATIIEGQHGVVIGTDGKWEFSGTGSVTSDGFTTSVTITQPTTDRAHAIATTQWNYASYRAGTVSITTDVTNWRKVLEIGNWTTVSQDGIYLDVDTPLFNSIAVKGNYAYVTSETSAGGAGLYVFDISNLSLPQRVADSFTLGAAGYDIEVTGNTLFVATDSTTSEVQSYDIASPTTLSVANLSGSYNLPGDGRARSLQLFGDTLFVGAAESATDEELYSFDIATPGTFTLLDAYDDSGGYLDISLHNGYAYVASTKDISELIVADIFDPENINIATGSGYNLTDVLDGQAVQAFGTSALLGRATAPAIQELVLFSIAESPVPNPPPGPWYQNIGDSVNAIDVEPGQHYAFIATNSDGQEMQVIDLILFTQGLPSQVETFDSDTGVGRSIAYDPLRDRVFLSTNSAFIILEPGS